LSHVLYPDIPLQIFFVEPVLESEHCDLGYTDHATDVWRVRTPSQSVALRLSEVNAWHGPFWDGLRRLFTWRALTPSRVAQRNRFLFQAGGLPVPSLLRHGHFKDPLRHLSLSYLILEWLPGQRCATFAELSEAGLESYGTHLARLHGHIFPQFGALAGAKSCPPEAFGSQVAKTLTWLAQAYFQDDPVLTGMLPEMCRQAHDIPPAGCVPVLVDLDPTQYLRNEKGELCALIDTDAYVLGPRELDFIALEYLLTAAQAASFVRGYSTILPLPDLSEVRTVYRYLYRLMEVFPGDFSPDDWLTSPTVF
jgi:hypothetical protein